MIDKSHHDFHEEIKKILTLTQLQISKLSNWYIACTQNPLWEDARRKATAVTSFHVVYQATYEYWHELEKTRSRDVELGSAKEVAMAAFFGLKAKKMDFLSNEEFEVLFEPWKEVVSASTSTS